MSANRAVVIDNLQTNQNLKGLELWNNSAATHRRHSALTNSLWLASLRFASWHRKMKD